MEVKNDEKGLLSRRVAVEYLTKENDYGENSFDDADMMINYTGRIADMLSLDKRLAQSIYVGIEMSDTCFGDIGKNFVSQKLDGFDIKDYASTLIGLNMRDESEDFRGKVQAGVSHVLDSKFANNEELLVQIMRYALNIGNTYQDPTGKSTFIGEYIAEIVRDSVQGNKLRARKIDVVKHEVRSKKQIMHKQEKYILLESLFDYYDQGVLRLPEEFREVEEENKKKAICYFLASRSEEELERTLEQLKSRDVRGEDRTQE